MPSKLERAQAEYERLLLDLGEKAELVGLLAKADDDLREHFREAGELLRDREVELKFVQGEHESFVKRQKSQRKGLQDSLGDLREKLDKTTRAIAVRRDKLTPIRQKLAGGEYDLKFVEKALAEEHQKKQYATDVQDPETVRECEEEIKHLKLEVMKRRRGLDQLRQQIEKTADPLAELQRTAQETQKQIQDLEVEQEALEETSDEEMLADLKRQVAEKEHQVQRARQHLLDTRSDLAENLYQKRTTHPVLNKYYQDLDEVAAIIDTNPLK